MKWDTEKLATCGLVVLVLYVALAAVFRAASKPLWFDELLTLAVAQQPTVSGIWDALSSAVESDPPPFSVAERIAGAVVPNEHIAYRLPSILALCCVVLCVFVFVRRRSGARHALISASVPLVSILYSPYAVEARGYALATACIAAALVCYQNVHSLRCALLMGISLAAASAAHYYAVFALVPFALAEAVFTWKTRQLRWSVWLATACGVVPLIVFMPMLLNLGHYYGPHYGRGAQQLKAVAEVYGLLISLPAGAGAAIAAVVALGVLEAVWPWGFRKGEFRQTLDEFVHEKVLVLGLLVLPFVFFLAMKIVHGGIVTRYLLETLVGFSLAAGCILPRLERRSVILFGMLLLFAFALNEGQFWVSQRHNLGKIVSPVAAIETLVNAVGRPDLPVVVSHGFDYLQLVHYASREAARRYVAVVDVPASMTYAGSDFMDKGLLALRPYAPVQVYQFKDFSANYRQFLLYSRGCESGDWWPTRLLHDDYTLTVLGIHDNGKLYLVTKGGKR